MRLLHSLRSVACVAVCWSLGACASVSVKDMAEVRMPRLERPARFVVMPFTVDAGRVKENPMRKNPGQLASDAQGLLAEDLRLELQKLGYPVSMGNEGMRGTSTWVVTGRITRLAEGNRLLRMGLGLGMGGTKFETEVEVRAGTGSPPFLRFATTGGSNATPGAATMPIPFSGLPTALMNSKDGITADADRTARMVTATIAGELKKRGWLSVNVAPPKMAHE